MKKYLSLFRLRFITGMQYRTAAIAGIVTQFVWGGMEIMIFRAFYKADVGAFPMSFSATSSYIWLQQAFLAFYMAWMMENEIFDMILSGNVVYELCRPIDIYNLWFFRSMAKRMSMAVLRCFPILFVAVFLPKPYGITMPAGMGNFALFIITMFLGLAVAVSLCMMVYMLTFFTISSMGLRMLFISASEFFAGAVIPLPFFPERLQKIMEILPFASMQNVPFRIYSGSMSVDEMRNAVILQVFWLVVVTAAGKMLCKKAERHIVVQGG